MPRVPLRSLARGAVGCAQGAKRPERGAPSRGSAPRGGAALEPVMNRLMGAFGAGASLDVDAFGGKHAKSSTTELVWGASRPC